MRTLAVLLLGACGDDANPAVDAAPVPVDVAPDGPAVINGCTESLVVDLTAPAADRTIRISDDFYTPRCPRISVGQAIVWTGDFGEHPLAPGIVRPPNIVTQPGNPIPMVTSGSSQSVTFTAAGEWAFYCPNHTPGMSGLVYVVP